MYLRTSNIEEFTLGCAILSAGGGGDPTIGLVMARYAIENHGPVEVIGLQDLEPTAVVLPCGLIGSPTVAQERVWSGDEGAQLVNAVNAITNRPIQAMMCYEIAGVNGLLPVLWAARLGMPLLDADGMGRAFPEMQQQMMHVAGVKASPIVLCDGRGNVIVVDAANNLDAERLVRSSTATFGGVCAGALYSMTAAVAATSTIQGSISNAVRIGTTMSACERAWTDVLAEETGGSVLIEGRIGEIQRRGGDAFSRGHAIVDGTGPYLGRRLRLELQNEVLLAIEDGEVVATVPDIIAVLSLADGRPVSTERLQYGQRAGVVSFPSPMGWQTERGLQVVGPRAFGYDLDYQPHRPAGGHLARNAEPRADGAANVR